MTQNALMQSNLTLGIVQNTLGSPVQQTLKYAEIAASTHVFQTQEMAIEAVSGANIQAFACPLHLVPTTLPMGLVITALSERKVTNNCLITKYTEGGLFSEKEQPKVLTFSEINRAQMQYLQPNYIVEKTNMSLVESLEAVRAGAYDAVVLNQFDVNMLDLQGNEWSIQPFSLREFITPAGQGVDCYIVAEEDLPTRRLLKTVHHPSVSAVTNIERTVQKMLKDYEVCAYCERDRMGNYHLWAAALVNNELRKTRLSQSTSYAMAEKAVEQLLSA